MKLDGPPAFGRPDPARKQDIRRELRESRAVRAAVAGTAEAVAAGVARGFARSFLDADGVAWDRRAPRSRVLLAGGDTVALYLSRRGEPGTEPLRAMLAERGVRVLLPWLREDRDLDWVVDPGPGASPSLRPAGRLLGRSAVADARVVVVPALAADTVGRRLGQGGGSYDRVLARLDGRRDQLVVVACVHDDELVDGDRPGLPEEEHDRRVDAVLTPGGLAVV